MCLRVQWVRLTEAAICRRDTTYCKVRDSACTCVPCLQQREKDTSEQLKCFKVTEVEFLFGAKKPTF